MCFSSEASFAVGAALLPAGAYCIRSAMRKAPRLLPLAVVPVVFGLQQISEGFVWLGLHAGDPTGTRSAALVFLFFALAFWPFWFPFLAAVAEPRRAVRLGLAGLAVLATVWFWVLYYPLLTGPESLLTVETAHHSIRYSYPGLAVYEYVPRPLLRVLYLLTIVVPIGFGSVTFGRLPAVLLGASAVVAASVFEYAFVSVWCFFAAVLTGYLCVLFHRLPEPAPEPPPPSLSGG
jgi:hypothetical protein